MHVQAAGKPSSSSEETMTKIGVDTGRQLNISGFVPHYSNYFVEP